MVSGSGSPPAAETRNSPLPCLAKMIVSSGPQLAPRGPGGMGQRVIAAPPVTCIFLRVESTPVENPIHCPSGEKKRLPTLSTPASNAPSRRSTRCT